VPSTAVLCGGGDNLRAELEGGLAGSGMVIAADGATSTLVAAGIRPDMVVTDLDGVVEDQVEVNGDGCIVFVHGHGDNRGAVAHYARRFTGPVVCTCQCPPVEGVYNFGGFTDGDRAACIAAAVGVRKIRLAGFDFDNPSSKAGRPAETKGRKLAWAKRVLSMLVEDGVVFDPPL
jgi:uncharacterized Rossmann fold enzyme